MHYGFSISNFFLGHAARGGNPWDFDGRPVRVTWDGGNDRYSIPPRSAKTSDTIAFSLIPGKDLIIAWDTEADRPHGFKSKTGVEGVQGYFKPSSQLARFRAPTGMVALAPELLLGIEMITVATRQMDFKSVPQRFPLEYQTDNPRIIWFNERAIEDYDKAIQLDPTLAEAYYNRGRAYAELGMLERARSDLDKADSLG